MSDGKPEQPVGMHRTPLPHEFTVAPFSVAMARDHGLSKDRLRASDLTAPYRGVRLATSTAENEPARRYAPRLIDGQFFSHTTAARLHGLPVPARLGKELHVSAIQPVRAPRIPGVTAHHIRSSRATVTSLDGIRVASPEAAWISLAPLLTLNELVVVGDALLRRQQPLSDLRGVSAAVRRARGGRGTAKLSAALQMVRSRTDSVQESWLRIRVMAAGLSEPEVNSPIFRRNGSFIGFADLCWPKHRVILEYDGEQHQNDESQYLKDIDRLEALMAEDYRVIRANKAHQPWFRTPIARTRAALARARDLPVRVDADR